MTTKPPKRPLSVRLPGFVADRDIGLGDAITRVGRAVGLRPAAAARAGRRSSTDCSFSRRASDEWDRMRPGKVCLMDTQDTEAPPHPSIVPAEAPMPCPTCADASAAPYVYAIGRIEARFTTLSAEKEFAQAAGRTDATGQTDQQTLHTVLSEPRNRYLARQMCWVLRIQGLETWLLRPRDAGDLALLIDAIRPAPTPGDIDVVIGTAGPVAGPDVCNGLMLPMLMFEQLYSFDRDTLIRAIPRPEKTTAAQFRRWPRSCSSGSFASPTMRAPPTSTAR